jgi:hypothetical protein
VLNQHIFGNIPMKIVDFKKPVFYSMLTVKKPDGKK